MTVESKTAAAASPRVWDGFGFGLFWSWNLIFLAFVLLGFGPTIMPEMLIGVFGGVIPAIYLFFTVVLVGIPVVCVILALTRFRKRPQTLLALGYVIEGPLLLMMLFRFFAVRQGNPAITALMLIAALGMVVYLDYLLRPAPVQHTAWRTARLGGLTLLFACALYGALVVAFYVPPLAVLLVRLLGDIGREFTYIFSNPQSLWALFTALFGLLLMVYSGTLLLGMPVIAPVLVGRAWLSSLRDGMKSHGRLIAAVQVLVPLALAAAVVGVSMRQLQGKAFTLLEQPPASAAEAQALLDHSEEIRSGLVNAYLGTYRYFSAAGEMNHIRDLYSFAFNMYDEQAYPVQAVFERVISPLLYQPKHPHVYGQPERQSSLLTDQSEAAVLYKQFFDADINNGERAEMVKAARATFDSAQAEAAWQAVDDREIQLLRQEVNVKEFNGWAEVELYEVYQNRTESQQEVVYYFSLPESAVVTGLWLGPSSERANRFTYRVAPRGAAQAVYRNEIRVRMDPALLEQLGPRQYRLRVFPVEGRRFSGQPGRWDRQVLDGAELHMWMTYSTLAVDGQYPLPRLSEKRNVYWDPSSVRLVNGQPTPAGADEWLPASLPAAKPGEEHLVHFAGGEIVRIRPAAAADLPALPSGLKAAVVLDRSRSMVSQDRAVQDSFAALRAALGDNLDVYLTSSPYRGEPASKVALARLDAQKILYFGGQNASDLLNQFEALQGDARYDVIFVLTDGTGYELGEQHNPVAVPDAPVWLVHLGGRFPLGYDDPTLDAVQVSGGGVAGSVPEALLRLAAGLQHQNGDFIDGYTWQVLSPGEQAAINQPVEEAGTGLGAIAARRLVLSTMDRSGGKQPGLETLDRVHKVAVENSIVTPFSSMIVLVDDRQLNLLKRMEESGDRFDREVEQVGETVPLNGMIAGVPEPEEWLLMILAAALLGYFVWRKKQAAIQL